MFVHLNRMSDQPQMYFVFVYCINVLFFLSR